MADTAPLLRMTPLPILFIPKTHSRGNQIGENLLFKTLVIRVEQVERRLNYIEMKAMTPRCFEHIQVNVWIFCAR